MTIDPRLAFRFWWSMTVLADKSDRPCWYTWAQIETKTRREFPTHPTGGQCTGHCPSGGYTQARRPSRGEG
jgi:hypothetical protein